MLPAFHELHGDNLEEVPFFERKRPSPPHISPRHIFPRPPTSPLDISPQLPSPHLPSASITSPPDLAQVVFDPEIALCQLAHTYIGMEHATDKLDMRNDFLFTGMAITRDRCYGMTSCGTGGIWAITSPVGVGSYFYGRTMIEDTSTSHAKFLQGRRSIYIAPSRSQKWQLMSAVPKVSANYLEALERWDTGAVQVLVAQGLFAPWFWVCLVLMYALCFAVLAPTFYTRNVVVTAVLAEPFKAVRSIELSIASD